MKILAVIGSPRGRGAGYQVVKKIEERMKALGEVEFTYLFLKDANLKLCAGCYTCMAKGEDKCPLKDDRARDRAATACSGRRYTLVADVCAERQLAHEELSSTGSPTRTIGRASTARRS